MAARLKPITMAAVAFFVSAAIAPLFVPSWATLVALILAKSIVVLGIVLLLQAGQVSFGHAMFLRPAPMLPLFGASMSVVATSCSIFCSAPFPRPSLA